MKKIVKEYQKRFKILLILIVLIFSVLILFLFNLQIVKHRQYKDKYINNSENIVEGKTAPRGKIYDRFGRLIVDNKPIKSIYYKKIKGTKLNDEIDLAYKAASILDIDYHKISDDIKRTFWVKINQEKAKNKITDQELIKLKYRELTGKDIEQLKKDRITDQELNSLTNDDLEAAYVYYLMNKGYSYSEKLIKKNVTDTEFVSINDDLKGFYTKLDWDRDYLYGNNFRSVLGSVGEVPQSLKEYYINKGYDLSDRVGVSYLEYQYDDYLRGVKSKYKVNKDNSLELISEGSKGNDIYLTIDIELEKAIEQILEEEIIKAKSEANTRYYNRSFVIITDPKTGEILAMTGKQLINVNGENIFYDYTPGIFTAPVTVGSVVKGASHIVGYNTGSLKIGEIRNDGCVKLKSAPQKCSWKYLGNIDDLKALKLSSNTYQFYTALKVANVKYFYDIAFKLENDAFKIYRDTFKEFGLGVKTGIDLPYESSGLEGKNDSSGLLLDFSIGQYDNYTPLQLSQYISTIANNGVRMKYHLLKSYKKNNKLIEVKPSELNKVNTEQIYLDRIKEGFRQVLDYGGTGAGYIDLKYMPAGKTGTSQSFIDTNGDNKVDTETVSNTFVAYAPYNDPKVTFTVVSPDTYDYGSNYQTYVNKRISKRISEKYFEIYG